MSTNPGATTRPDASIVRVAGSSISPMATMRPSRIPTSARRRAVPVPSMTLPPAIFTSSTVVSFRCVPGARSAGSVHASGKAEQLGGLVGRGDGAAEFVGERDRVAHQLLVGRSARPRVVLEPDADVPAALEGDAGDAA